MSMKENNVLSIFDFDKTLIRRDSFRIFSLLASEKAWEKVLVLLLALCNKAGLISNKRYKEWVLRIVWLTKGKRERERLLQDLYVEFRRLENPEVLNSLKSHVERGDSVVVLSASPTFYLRPYVRFWSEDVEVFGSELQFVNRKITFQNLYGSEKVLCAKSIIEQKRPSMVWVYTDHISDLPIIQLADCVRLVKPSRKLCARLRQLNIKYEIVSLCV